MTDANTGNAAHYAALAVKMLKHGGQDDLAGALDKRLKIFKDFRLLQPKKLIEQPFPVVERMVTELQVHANISNDVLTTIWHLKCQQMKPGTVGADTIFDKQRPWRLQTESECVLNLVSPELAKLAMSSDSKVKGFLRCHPTALTVLKWRCLYMSIEHMTIPSQHNCFCFPS